MSILPPNPIIYTQEVGVAKLAQAADQKPEVLQNAAQIQTKGVLRNEGEQIQRPDVTTLSPEVDSDGDSDSSPHYAPRQRNNQNTPDASKQPDDTLDPLVGNLLNVKV